MSLLRPPNRAGHYIFPLWFLLFFLAFHQRWQIGCLPYFHTKSVVGMSKCAVRFLKRWQVCSRISIIYPTIAIFILKTVKIACLFNNNDSVSCGLRPRVLPPDPYQAPGPRWGLPFCVQYDQSIYWTKGPIDHLHWHAWIQCRKVVQNTHDNKIQNIYCLYAAQPTK